MDEPKAPEQNNIQTENQSPEIQHEPQTPVVISGTNKSKSRYTLPIAALFVVLFAGVGIYMLHFGFANPNASVIPKPAVSETPPKPFVDNPERGLAWAGLKKADNGTCGKAFEMVSTDGTSLGCSHGPDPAPAGVNIQEPRDFSTMTATDTTSVSTGGTINSSGVACIGDGVSGQRVQMVYAVASDQVDRYTSLMPNFQTWGGEMQNELTQSAAKTGGERYFRFVTNGDCSLNVLHVTLSPTGDDNFSNTITEMRAQGYNLSSRKYVIWTDALVYCGIGQVGGNDVHGDTNTDNTTVSYARVDSGCWGRTDHLSETHELMHNLAAVQLSAPHSTGGYHCTDEYDLMCYADATGVVMTQSCDVTQEWLLDCNNDDYFNTNPAPNSYLATHWNVADSFFLAKSLTSTTTVVDTKAPTAPTSLVASAPDSAHVNLNWNPSTDEVGGSGLAGYKIYRNGSLYQTLTSTTNAYSDTGVTGGTAYTYAVTGYDNAGNTSAQSNTISVTTPSNVTADTTPPTITVTQPANGSTISGRVIVAASATDNVKTTYMDISVDGVMRASTNATSIKWTWNTNKTPKGQHTITVRARDAAGNVAVSTVTVTK